MRKTILRALCATTMCILVARADDTPVVKVPEAPQVAARVAGYLSQTDIPSSVSIVPAPPIAGSAAMARDEEINRSALTMHGTPRWDIAAKDAVLTFPALAETFACALNVPISQERTPKLIALLRRAYGDAGRATGEAKRLYQRTRPFVVNEKPMCTPNLEAGLRGDGSYPSGHSSVGWAIGLVLSEVSPSQTNALVARGRAFGQSRLVCNVHWQSDVLEGQMVGAAVVARLHAEPEFRNDVLAARIEVEALRAQGLPMGRNCEAEAQALKSWQ